MLIQLNIPDAKVPGLAAALAAMTPKLDEDDNGGKIETDGELILRHFKMYAIEQDQQYRQHEVSKLAPDTGLLTATDVTP